MSDNAHCPSCQGGLQVPDEVLKGPRRKVSCYHCDHRFFVGQDVKASVREVAAEAKIDGKKRFRKSVKAPPATGVAGLESQAAQRGHGGKRILASAAILALAGAGGFLGWQVLDRDKGVMVVDEVPAVSATVARPILPAGFLHDVARRSTYKPSPEKKANQWEYARIAETPCGEAGNYVVLGGNAELPFAETERSIGYALAQDAIINWHEVGETAVWELAPTRFGGTYKVYGHYGAADGCDGNQFQMELAGRKFIHRVRSTGGYDKIQSHEIGSLKLKAGQALRLSMQSTKINPNTGLLDLRAIEIVPTEVPHRWYDAVTGNWRRDVPASMRFPGEVCDQAPPAHLIEGGPKGYAIVTTKAIRDNSKVMADFVAHKKRLGYTVMTITEDDFGGGKGPDAAENIRAWLHANCKKLDLLYVVFIGNPNPSAGEIPMYPVATNIEEFRAALARGEHPHAGRPSDLPYMDCSGPSTDVSGDGRLGDGGDYVVGTGLDTQWDVLVGRIPYYGEASAWGRFRDVDAILQKIMDYENATPEEILERYNFEIDTVLDGHVTEYAGHNYVTREQSHRGRLTLDHFSWQNNSFMDQYNVGFIRSGGHASPTFIESGVTSGWLANRTVPKATCQVLAEYGGCDCSQPEHPMNMGYMHLRQGAIATVGASRSIASVRGHGERTRPTAFHNIRLTSLMRGISVGQAHWQGLTGGRQMPNGGAQMWTLYGDPSVVPFPERLHPRRSHALRPVHDLEHFEPMQVESSAPTATQEYDLQNLSGSALKWSAEINVEWAELRGPLEGSLDPEGVATVRLILNQRARQLPAGMKRATITFKIGSKVEYRNFEYNRTIPKVTHQFAFDDKEGGSFLGKRDGKHKVFDRFCSDNFINRSFSFEIKPNGRLPHNATVAAGPRFRVFVNGDQTLQVDWQPYPYGEHAWNPRFGHVTTDPKDSVVLKTKTGLLPDQVNRITVSTDFITDEARLFLNGEEQASCSMNKRLFLPWKSDIGHGLNAAIDNFIVETRASTAEDEAATFANGYPASSPTPQWMESGVNRLPTLKWALLPSRHGIAEPRFKVYLGTDKASLASVGSTADTELVLTDVLAPEQTYYWRVDVASADGARVRTGRTWQFRTGKYVSREVIPFPEFAMGDKWPSQWPAPVREANGVIAFKGFGHNVSQALDSKLLVAGGYRIRFTADCREQKPTRPMLFKLYGKNAAGENVDFVSQTIELNDLKDGSADAYFELEESLVTATEVRCRLQIPNTPDNDGRRSPYWVFGTKLSLFNNVDLSAIPNRPPRFRSQNVTLPNMPAMDNSYAYTFANEVEDERPDELTFRKLEGPEWISVQPSGRLFSYHGAPLGTIGKHRLRVEVVDHEGLTDSITVSLEVSVPGEVTLPASEAALSPGKEIRMSGNLITHIIHDEATATWTFKPAKTGVYEITLYAGSPDDNVAKLTVKGGTRKFPINKTGGYRAMRAHPAGTFHLTKGEVTQVVLGVVERRDGLCDVSHVHVMPVDEGSTN
jgi:hypothetical protein